MRQTQYRHAAPARLAAVACLGILLASVASAAPTTAVEFFNAELGHYFVTAAQDEIASLEDGKIAGWGKTGYAFTVETEAGGNRSPVCRFFSAVFAPKSSHFYTPYDEECAALKSGTTWTYESIAFYVDLPSPEGACQPQATALFRLYNNGEGGAPNHRYTTSPAIVAAMQLRGWTLEGNGTTGVFACAAPPPSGKTAMVSIESSTTQVRYDVAIYVPVGYDAYSAPVPVIYALDAQIRFQSLLDAMRQTAAKAILVQIYDMGLRQTDFNMPGASDFLAFLKKDLIPYIESNYRADLRQRVVSGLSTGGNFPFHALALEAPGPYTFAHYWSTEAAFWQQQTLVFSEEQRMFDNIGQRPFPVTLIIACGTANGPLDQVLYDAISARHYQQLRLIDLTYPLGHVETDVPSFIDELKILTGR